MEKNDDGSDELIPDEENLEPVDPTPSRLADPVGNKMPPASKRFRKGVSGNPKGRPRKKSGKSTKVRTRKEIAKEVLLEKNRVTIDGKDQHLTAAELLVHKLRDLALTGNAQAVKLLDELRATLAPEPLGEYGVLVVPGRLTREAWERQFGKQQPQELSDAEDVWE